MGTPIPFIHLLWLSWGSRPRHYIRQSKIFHRILDQEPSLRDIAVGRDTKSTCWKYQPNKNQPIYRYHVSTPIPLLPNHTNQTPKKTRFIYSQLPPPYKLNPSHPRPSFVPRKDEREADEEKKDQRSGDSDITSTRCSMFSSAPSSSYALRRFKTSRTEFGKHLHSVQFTTVLLQP